MKSSITSLFILVFQIVAFASITQNNQTGAIYGRVTSAWGDPLIGAEITFFRYTWQDGALVILESKPRQRAETDKDGNYKVAEMPSGYYRVSVNLRGFASLQNRTLYVQPGKDNLLDLGLDVGLLHEFPPLIIRGTIQRSDKTPITDATVTVLNAATGENIGQTRTDNRGEYRMQWWGAPGQFVVYALKQGYEVNAVGIHPRVGEEYRTRIILMPLRKR